MREALLTPDDGTVLLGLITIVGWVAWLVFAVSVLAELVATRFARSGCGSDCPAWRVRNASRPDSWWP